MRMRRQIVSSTGLNSRVGAVLRKQQQLRNQPPDDTKLARIWPPWNKCPPDVPAEGRVHILSGDPRLGNDELLSQLKQEFPDLPLDRDEYWTSFQAAERWDMLTTIIRTTSQLHQELVVNQWAFNDSDNQAQGRIAMFRAAKELETTHPGLIAKTAPALAEITRLQKRYNAYAKARRAALKALARILYKVPGIRTGKKLPWDEQARGVPWPPKDVPHYLYIARLDALEICSRERFEKFMREDFLKLTREQRHAFYRMSLKPRRGKESHAALAVWLLDNVPVFKAFDWRWPEIHTAALDLRLLDRTKHPSHESLEKWASRRRITWTMKLGVGRPHKEQRATIALSTKLLSPSPRFGDILKRPTSPAA